MESFEEVELKLMYLTKALSHVPATEGSGIFSTYCHMLWPEITDAQQTELHAVLYSLSRDYCVFYEWNAEAMLSLLYQPVPLPETNEQHNLPWNVCYVSTLEQVPPRFLTRDGSRLPTILYDSNKQHLLFLPPALSTEEITSTFKALWVGTWVGTVDVVDGRVGVPQQQYDLSLIISPALEHILFQSAPDNACVYLPRWLLHALLHACDGQCVAGFSVGDMHCVQFADLCHARCQAVASSCWLDLFGDTEMPPPRKYALGNVLVPVVCDILGVAHPTLPACAIQSCNATTKTESRPWDEAIPDLGEIELPSAQPKAGCAAWVSYEGMHASAYQTIATANLPAMAKVTYLLSSMPRFFRPVAETNTPYGYWSERDTAFFSRHAIHYGQDMTTEELHEHLHAHVNGCIFLDKRHGLMCRRSTLGGFYAQDWTGWSGTMLTEIGTYDILLADFAYLERVLSNPLDNYILLGRRIIGTRFVILSAVWHRSLALAGDLQGRPTPHCGSLQVVDPAACVGTYNMPACAFVHIYESAPAPGALVYDSVDAVEGVVGAVFLQVMALSNINNRCEDAVDCICAGVPVNTGQDRKSAFKRPQTRGRRPSVASKAVDTACHEWFVSEGEKCTAHTRHVFSSISVDKKEMWHARCFMMPLTHIRDQCIDPYLHLCVYNGQWRNTFVPPCIQQELALRDRWVSRWSPHVCDGEVASVCDRFTGEPYPENQSEDVPCIACAPLLQGASSIPPGNFYLLYLNHEVVPGLSTDMVAVPSIDSMPRIIDNKHVVFLVAMSSTGTNPQDNDAVLLIEIACMSHIPHRLSAMGPVMGRPLSLKHESKLRRVYPNLKLSPEYVSSKYSIRDLVLSMPCAVLACRAAYGGLQCLCF